MIELLTRLNLPGEPRLAVVIGSSGSGKSSLVRAGVLPRLAKDPDRWAVVPPFRPGADPVGELARAVASAFPEGPDRSGWRALRDRLRAGGEASSRRAPSLVRSGRRPDDGPGSRREAGVPLVVLDQAEELLQSMGAGEAEAFLTALLRALARPGGRVFGLMTLRSDFLGSFQNHPAMRGVAFADVPLGPMPMEGFPQLIEGPAARAGITLEPGLVATMVADARTDDALPLLAFTLREMYERGRDGAEFTRKLYRDDLGGINGAVARAVERIKPDGVAWTPEVNLAIRRAFLKLVRVNDEGQYTRQRARWADLPDQAAPVLEALVGARLLTSDGDMVEVAHESLFRVWPELAGWLDEERELMLWRKGIQDDLRDWASHGRSPGWLLAGARVAEARRWLARNADDFPGPGGGIPRRRVSPRTTVAAAAERRSRRQLRTFAVGASVLAAIAIGLGVATAYSRQETQRELAMMFQKSGQQECEDRRLGPGLTQLVRALSVLPRSSPGQEWETRLQIASWGGAIPRLLPRIDLPLPVLDADIAPDGARLATVDNAGRLQTWDIDRRRSAAGPVPTAQNGPGRVFYGGRGDFIVTAKSRLDSVRLWSVKDLTPLCLPVRCSPGREGNCQLRTRGMSLPRHGRTTSSPSWTSMVAARPPLGGTQARLLGHRLQPRRQNRRHGGEQWTGPPLGPRDVLLTGPRTARRTCGVPRVQRRRQAARVRVGREGLHGPRV